jgi:YebC/PmpR family DNA-binding regulatory protein
MAGQGGRINGRPFRLSNTESLKFKYQKKGFQVAGHSKWANIQHRKGRQDEKRGKVWTRVIREIMVAARGGGADMNVNPRLRLAVDKAKAANMPADTIKRNIDKATGNLEGVHYEEIRYEGYGVGGVALMVDTMTDNKVRTVAEVRHALSKHGGNLGSDGSVAYQFKHCGQFIFAPGADEDRLMEVALEAGADDVINSEDGAMEVLCSPSMFEPVKIALEGALLLAVLAEITYRPEISVALAAADAEKMQKILDVLDELDDVQEVYHNAEL